MMRKEEGFSLLELLVVIAIIAIIAALSFAGLKRAQSGSRKAKCIGQMRAFHGALSSAIIEQGEWPQLPIEDGAQWTEEKYYEWWALELQKYNLPKSAWVCPSDKNTVQKLKFGESEDFTGSYAISTFQPGPKTPFLFSQPWVIERGSYHRSGGHILLPDGSIDSQLNPFFGR